MQPTVETRYGRLRGTESKGIRCFRGIRYARAARGSLRFQPPRTPEPWTGVRNATQPGPAAPQFSLPWFGWISAAGVSPGQDCLSLNVWSPGLDEGRRPVLVWIHGGGFLVGSGATPVYNGQDLSRRGNVVVVTINYRLGALGYAHLNRVLGEGFEQSSNLGVRDQIAALEWVRDHIERFGGDPGNVTLVGQSAGAMSIGALLGAPRARQLFHRAVLQSGAAEHVIEPEEAAFVARAFLGALGGPPPSPDALGRISVRQILAAQRSIMNELSDWNRRLMVFLPSVDGDIIPEQPIEAVKRGELAHIPLLIGTTLDEWKLFRLVDRDRFAIRDGEILDRVDQVLEGYPGAPAAHVALGEYRAALRTRGARTRSRDVWNAFQSARVFHYPAMRLAEAHTAGGADVYSYLFTWRSPTLRGSLGACHALELPFVWGFTRHPLALPLLGVDRTAPRLSRVMQRAWAAFARDGVPRASGLPKWERYDPVRRATMVLGRRCALDDAPLDAERQLWERWAHC
jgi:para-nitrobenzyl esterase